MSATEALARGRLAYAQEAWSEAYVQLTQAGQASPLDAEDLDCLATAAFLVGEDTASASARAHAHQAFLERGDTTRAARSAFWLAFIMLDQPGQQAQAAGWLARARRLLDESANECAEQGFLLCARAFQSIQTDDIAAAETAFRQAAEIGARFNDRDLVALARHGQGRVLLRLNKTADGLAMLDEVMVGVTCGEIGPLIAGIVYCSVISACHDLFDLRRATEWTAALAGWCAAHPDMLPFRGDCLIRRSELLQLHGTWEEALAEAEHACTRLGTKTGQRDAGAAHYQLAELYRLRGDFKKADDHYRSASQEGRNPHPGLALLRLAQGEVEAAEAAIRHELQRSRRFAARAQVLRAAVEIMLSVKDVAAARNAADELRRTASELDAPLLHAAGAQASGAVALAEGDATMAVALLRDACAVWRELDVPYEIARVRALMGLAYRELGDDEGAQMELEAAAEGFDRLGAAPDAVRVTALMTTVPSAAKGPLTGREIEVLRLIATGKTNRMIATELAISEKTVARHVSNIFTKLDLPSRSAATAYAYSNKLV